MTKAVADEKTDRDADLREASARLSAASASDILSWAGERFAPHLAFATGFGPEGLVLLDLIALGRLDVDVFTLDTGLFFPETYELWRRLESRYGLTIRAVPPALSVDEQAVAHGDALWLREPDRCCGIRKVAPLEDALRGHEAWISAIRADQTAERGRSRVVERDPRRGLVKVNPLLAWTSEDVWRYLHDQDIPTNPLHAKGYPSIGCWPCTSPVRPGEDPRAGRWRGQAKTECGLHTRPSPASYPSFVRKEPRFPMSQDQSPSPVPPHGGVLVDRFVPVAEAEALRRRAASLPAVTLDARELADLELIATGAASPLTGFLGAADYVSVVTDLRLADGTVWPLPLTLAFSDEAVPLAQRGGSLALHDAAGRLWGILDVTEVFVRDPLHEALHVYGTEDPAHPGVAYLLARPRTLVGGPVHVLPLPADLPFAAHRLTPHALRALIVERGWRKVAGFQTRNPIHRAHEHLTKLALEVADGLVVHPLVGETKNDDVPAAVRFRAYETLLDAYYPRERTVLAAFPAAMRYAGPREALFHALVRKNYGITHLIVGRDHAGVGRYYGPYEAQQIFDRFTLDELGITPLKFEPTFYCHACDTLASSRTCPHDESSRLELSGTKVREILRGGGRLPVKFTRPEVAEVLRHHYITGNGNGQGNGNGNERGNGKSRETGNGNGATHTEVAVSGRASTPQVKTADRSADQPYADGLSGRPGFIVWFTGLSGAGKSTLAEGLKARLQDERTVEILDGDEVRAYLSKGLGFSKEDRDTNIRRIGYVARLLARNGVAVVTAAISPYREVRDEVRRLAEADGIPFVEVFASASIEALTERDVKGLYEKARRGEIAHFTGVSDPYEPPLEPEVTAFTDRESVPQSLGRIVRAIEGRGLLDDRAARAFSEPLEAVAS